MALTGKFQFRKTLWGKIVVRVEEEVRPFWRRSKLKRRLRDATLMDLAAPEMRYLIDMGLKPWSRPQSQPAPSKVSDPQSAETPLLVEATPASIQQANGEAARTAH